jgi:hypothetical protein
MTTYLKDLCEVAGFPKAHTLLTSRALMELVEPATALHPSAKYHFDCINRLASDPLHSPLYIYKHLDAIHYHARWLSYFVIPNQRECLPRIAVMLELGDEPNERQRITLESISAQTYPAVHSVVIADLNNPNIRRFIAGLSCRVYALQQSHRNQAAAFNLLTTRHAAEFLVLAESGSMLEPDYINQQVLAFANAPARELIVHPKTIMFSRRVLHRTGLMDEWLHHHAAARYLFRIGEVSDAYFDRINVASSDNSGEHEAEIAAVALLNLSDAIANKNKWPSILDNWQLVSRRPIFQTILGSEGRYVPRAYSSFMKSLENTAASSTLMPLILSLMGVATARRQLSPRPELLAKMQEIEQAHLLSLKRNGKLGAQDRDWITTKYRQGSSELKKATAAALTFLPQGTSYLAVRQGLEMIRHLPTAR